MSDGAVLLDSGAIQDTLTYDATGYRFLYVLISQVGWTDAKLILCDSAAYNTYNFYLARDLSRKCVQTITATACSPHANNEYTGGEKYIYGIK